MFSIELEYSSAIIILHFVYLSKIIRLCVMKVSEFEFSRGPSLISHLDEYFMQARRTLADSLTYQVDNVDFLLRCLSYYIDFI
jgi:hypothetical protein